MKIALVNGPNLNLLGSREPQIYGTQTFENYLDSLRLKHPTVDFEYFQSNVEGELINYLQKCNAIFYAFLFTKVSSFIEHKSEEVMLVPMFWADN